MTTSTIFSRVYEVHFTTIVDRPELRGASLPSVPAGHRITDRRAFETQTGALALYSEMVSGDWDFGSEFLARVEVFDVINGNRSIARRVRREVVRERRSDGSVAAAA